jgi:hypothetical protein
MVIYFSGTKEGMRIENQNRFSTLDVLAGGVHNCNLKYKGPQFTAKIVVILVNLGLSTSN